MRRRRGPAVILAIASLAATLAFAGEPAEAPVLPRTVRLLVPQAAGGTTDQIARFVAERLAAALRVAVYVENKPGAAGLIGTETAARAPADGATVLVATSNSHAMAPHLMPKIPVDVLGDFAPVVNIGFTTKCLVVHASLPVRSLSEFIAYVRARPRQVHYGSAGVGSSNHIEGEVFASAAGIEWIHVPYRGSPQNNQGLLAGEVQANFLTTPHAVTAAQTGRVRVLVMFGDRRSPLLPEVPTAAELGFPGVETRTWVGLVVPAGTPAALVDRYNGAVNALLKTPEAREWMDQRGVEIDGGSAAAFGQMLRADHARWGQILRRINLQPR